jgi:hypothetical protein
VKLQTEISKIEQGDVERAYRFLHDNKLFEPTGQISRTKLSSVVDALKDLGDVSAEFNIDRLLLPGATRILE